jgi:hypothetical protein
MREPELHACAGGRVAVLSTCSPRARGANEDAAALIPVDAERAVLAVADGVGGNPGGARAAALNLRRLEAAVRAVPGDLRGSILDGIERANRAVLGPGRPGKPDDLTFLAFRASPRPGGPRAARPRSGCG